MHAHLHACRCTGAPVTPHFVPGRFRWCPMQPHAICCLTMRPQRSGLGCAVVPCSICGLQVRFCGMACRCGAASEVRCYRHSPGLHLSAWGAPGKARARRQQHSVGKGHSWLPLPRDRKQRICAARQRRSATCPVRCSSAWQDATGVPCGCGCVRATKVARRDVCI